MTSTLTPTVEQIIDSRRAEADAQEEGKSTMNAMVPFNAGNVEAYRASTDAASLCREIVVNTAKDIQGRKYVCVEGWQAIAIAHGCAASSRDVERIDGGVRAIGEVRRMSDGALLSTAEGFVGEDEPTWFGGTAKRWKWGKTRGEKIWYDDVMPKRPDYAIRAMAQTRAISRACRSAFAHVVVMIDTGLSTTPAEEVPIGGFDDVSQHAGNEQVDTGRGNVQKYAGISADQCADLRRLLKEAKSSEDAFVDHLKQLRILNANTLPELLAEKFEEARNLITDRIGNMKAAAAQRVNPQASEILTEDEILY